MQEMLQRLDQCSVAPADASPWIEFARILVEADAWITERRPNKLMREALSPLAAVELRV